MRRLMLYLCLLFIIMPVDAQDQTNTFTGTLDDNHTFYEYPIRITSDQTTLIADSIATSGDLDTIIYLLDDAGNILAQNDNRTRGDLNAYLYYPSASAGSYTLILARYDLDKGTTSGDFTLSISQTPTITELPAYDISTEALREAGYPLGEPKAPSDWTILVYYGGDTNLEGALINDLREFELAGGADDQMNIIALLDRSPAYSDVDGDWTGARLYDMTLNADADTLITSTFIADLGDVDMGDGLTLAQFLAWGIRHYPAEHYAIAFGSHGAGWQGVITDDTAHTIINLSELDHVFHILNHHLQPITFDLVINDACLMSSVEYHAVMARYAKTSFASPEIVIDPALDMTLFTNALRDNPTPQNITTIGAALIEKYITVDLATQNLPDLRYMTSAVTDLTQFSSIEDAVNHFADAILAEPVRFSAMLGEARDKAYTYSGFRNGSSLIDLGSLMRQVILLSDDEQIITRAQAVLAALEAAVVHRGGGESVAKRVLYQNIYFPAKAKEFDNNYFIHSPLTRWGEMLRAYYNALSPKQWKKGEIFHAPSAPQVFITNQYPDVLSVTDPLRMDMEVIGRNVAQGIFTADYLRPDGVYERLIEGIIQTEVVDEFGNRIYINQWGSGIESSTFQWDVTLFELSDGDTKRFVLVRVGDETVSLEGRYRTSSEADWHDVIVIFGDHPSEVERGIPIRVVSRDPNSDALAVISIPTGAQFQVYQTIVTESGKTQITPDERITFMWNDQVSLNSAVPAPTGDYNLGFVIETFGGTESSASVPVRVNNDDIDPNLRGYTDTQWGYTMVVSAEWEEPIYYEDLNYGEMYYKDGSKRLRVYRQVVEETPNAQTILAGFGFTQFFGEQTVTFNNLERTVITYADDEFVGTGVLIPIPDGDAIIISLEIPYIGQPDFDKLSQELVTILRRVRQFNPRDFIMNSTALWDSQTIGTLSGVGFGAIFNIPRTWRDRLSEEGIWVVASPDFAPHIIMRVAQLNAYDAERLLDGIIADYVQQDADNFIITQRRVYYAQYNTWQVALYTAERNGIPITGRVYATIGASNSGIVVWQQAPTEIAPTLFREIFEPIVDAISINKPYRSYPLSDYGFTLYYMRDFGYMQLVQNTGMEYLVARNRDTSVYLVEFFRNNTDTQAILADWQAMSGYRIIGEPEATTYNNKDGWVIQTQAEDDLGDMYNGYAFLTTSANGESSVLFHVIWTNTEAQRDVFDFYMGINDYGVESDTPVDDDFTYSRGWVSAGLPDLGLTFIYPDTWSNITYNDTFGEARYAVTSSPTESTVLSLYIQQNSDIDAFVELLYNYSNITLTPRNAVRLNGATGQLYDIVVTGEDEGSEFTAVGMVVAVANPDGYSYVFEFVDYNNRLPNVTGLMEYFLENLQIYPPAGASSTPIDTITYRFGELGMMVNLPTNWTEPEGDDYLVYSTSPDEDVMFYVYTIEDVISASQAIDYLINEYGIVLTTDITTTQIGGYEAHTFAFDYQDQVGIAFAMMLGENWAIAVSVEGYDQATVRQYYEAITQSITFVEE